MKTILTRIALGVLFFAGWFAIPLGVGLWLDSPIHTLHAQSTTLHAFHVSGAAIPTSVTVPVAAEGGSLTAPVLVDFLVIANTDSVSHTILVEDGQGTPFVFFNAYPIPASTTWTIPMGGTRFPGGFKWQSSSTTVMGTVTGRR